MLSLTLARRAPAINRYACDAVPYDADDSAEEPRVRRDLDAMYRDEAPRLARYFKFRFRGLEDPDDLVQEVFTRLAAGRPWDELRDPDGYFRRILRNFLIKRHHGRQRLPDFVPMEGVEPAIPPDQAHGIELTQMQERYRAAVEALPPRTREVFLMHRAEDLSVKVIAGRLGISTRTVEWHIGEAIARIGKALDVR